MIIYVLDIIVNMLTTEKYKIFRKKRGECNFLQHLVLFCLKIKFYERRKIRYEKNQIRDLR